MRQTRIIADKEKSRDPSNVSEEKGGLNRVAIQKSITADLNNTYAYLNGQVDFSTGVIDTIVNFLRSSSVHPFLTISDFLDHVVRDWPSKQHIHVNIKKPYFDRNFGQPDSVGGGV